MEFVMEILMAVYLELMMLIVPDMGNTKRKKIIAGILAIVSALGCIALFLVGTGFAMDGNDEWGMFFILLSISISAIQILYGIIAWSRRK
jgi:uncharacterized membrane protein